MIGNQSADVNFEENLAADVLEIITVFSIRVYGSRSHKNQQIVEDLKTVAKRKKVLEQAAKVMQQL